MFLIFPFLVLSKIKFGIMVDAGSTGTRAFIYTWESTKTIPDVHPHPSVKDAYSIELDIPLASAAKKPEVVNEIFEQIINYCSDKIPKEHVEKTRLFIFATAGMRLLQQKDQDRILNNVYNYLAENSPFKLKRRYIRVISGIEEGVYGWISVNHLLNIFETEKPTVGALDMGGASFQIAIQVPDGSSAPSIHNVTIGNKHLKLFAHSYLGYGVNQALRKITNSIAAVTNQKFITNPCVHNEYRNQFEDVFVVGSGNFSECSRLIDAMLIKSPEFETIQIPNIGEIKKFIAMASFFYVNRALNLSENSTLKDLKLKSEQLCSTPFYQAQAENPDDKYLSTYCWSSIYQYNMLTKGFGFNDRDVIVEKKGKINGVGLSWTTGAMLSEVAQIEIDDKEPKSIILLIISTIVIFMLCFFILTLVKSMKKTPYHVRGKHII